MAEESESMPGPDLSAYPQLAALRLRAEAAAAAGDPTAMNLVGTFARDAGDTRAAKSWFERAAAAGSTEAHYYLGVLSRDDGDDQAAIASWLKAAEAGNADAMAGLAELASAAGDADTSRAWRQRAREFRDPNDPMLDL